MLKRILCLTLFALLSAACAAAPAQAPQADTNAATDAGPAVVRIGWAGSPDTLNPGTAVLSEAYTLFELVYDSMYQLQLDGSYTLELADSVDVSDDGLVYTYHIRDGVLPFPRRGCPSRRRHYGHYGNAGRTGCAQLGKPNDFWRHNGGTDPGL